MTFRSKLRPTMGGAMMFLSGLVLLGILFSVEALAEEVTITYPDGTVFTVPEGSNVYVSSEALYRLVEATPVTMGVTPPDPVEPPVEPPTSPEEPSTTVYEHGLSSTASCATFDTSVGLTFEYVNWQRQCDTDKNGKYEFCLDYAPLVFSEGYTFTDQAFQRFCNQ